MKSKKFLGDLLLNIFSSALPLLILQLISLPFIASKVGGDKYGLIITLISVMTIIAFPVGNVLNNTRLLRDEYYTQSGQTGDFNRILSWSSIIAASLMVMTTLVIEPEPDATTLFLLFLIVAATIIRDYLVVSFRLELNYKNILTNNIYLSIGYLFGTLLFNYTGYWQLIYIAGLTFSLAFIFKNSNLHKESYKFTKGFQITWRISIQLYAASLLKTLVKYSDKMLILPILGPTNVAIYYSATIIGKIISMIIRPVNSVLLSYLIREKTISIKKLMKLLVSLSFIAIISYIVILIASPYFFKFFYPEWAKESMEIVAITTSTAVIAMVSAMIQPYNLRFNDTKWQILINGFYLITYIILSIILSNYSGLKGFSIGVLIATIINTLLQIIILVFFMKKERQ